jgi:hypothetical protein
MKATDRHLKLETKRLTRVTALKLQFPNQDLETHSSESSSSQLGQHQFLMSSSSTPLLPSIIESADSQASSGVNANSREGTGDDSREEVASPPSNPHEPIAEEVEGDEELSWGIPVSSPTHHHPTDTNDPQPHSISHKQKKKKHSTPQPTSTPEGRGEKILLPSAMAMVDTSLSSSLSGVSSSSRTPPSGEQSAPVPSSSSLLPPLSLRTRLQGLTSGLFKKTP